MFLMNGTVLLTNGAVHDFQEWGHAFKKLKCSFNP